LGYQDFSFLFPLTPPLSREGRGSFRMKTKYREPLAKVSEKDFEKSLPEELESIGYRFLNLSSFRSLLDDRFLSTLHIGLPYATFFWQLKGLNLRA